MSKPPRHCIFCGNLDLSKEHFWPKWCEPLFPRTAEDGRVEMSFAQADGARLVAPPVVTNRPGRVIAKKLRVVCRTCNNTWMSRIEAEAQPVLTPLIQGKPTVLDETQQKTLTEWVALKVMIAEHSKGVDHVTPQHSRAGFRATRRIPDGFQIWIGKCGEDRWRSCYYRSAATFGLPNETPKDAFQKNTETVAIGAGDLFIFTLARTTPVLFDFNLQSSRFLRLWPMVN